MTGELSEHDVDAIYEAAAQHSRGLRSAAWPELKAPRRDRRRARRSHAVLVSGLIVFCVVGIGVYAASSGWPGLPALEMVLGSITAPDRKAAPTPGASALPTLVVLPAPDTDMIASSAPAPAEAAPAAVDVAPLPAEVTATERPRPAATEPAAVVAAVAPEAAQIASPAPAPTADTPAPAAAVAARSEAAAAGADAAPEPLARPSFPLPQRRPVRAVATLAAASPAAGRPPVTPSRTAADRGRDLDQAASAPAAKPGVAPPPAMATNKFAERLGADPQPSSSPASSAGQAGASAAPQYTLQPPSSPRRMGPGGTALGPAVLDSGVRPAESGAAPPAPSVAAAQDRCLSGSGDDCAPNRNWYVGAQVSVAANAVNTFTAPSIDIKAELEKLGSANLVAGYKSNIGMRFEAELFHRRHGLSDMTVNSDGGAGTFLGVGDLDGRSGDGIGHLSMTGMMANVFQDFRLTDTVTPFIGGGIGVARVNVNNGGLPEATLVNGDDDVLAYQLGGGVNFALRDRVDLFIEYRYFVTDEYDMQYVTGDTVQGKLKSHNFGIGLRYAF